MEHHRMWTNNSSAELLLNIELIMHILFTNCSGMLSTNFSVDYFIFDANNRELISHLVDEIRSKMKYNLSTQK